MIKNDLVKKIATKHKLSLSEAEKIIETSLEEIVNGLGAKKRVEFRRFGVFTLKQQKARTIVLPSGKKIVRPAKKIVLFSPSQIVLKRLNTPARKKTRVL
jgi:nucleoid DNA-binding protein